MTRNLRITTIPLILSSAVAAGAAVASDYQAEADVSWGQSHAWGGGLNYYLDPVSTDEGPLAEAAFINRATRLGLGAGYNTDTSAKSFGGSFDHYIGDLYLSGSASRTSLSTDASDSRGEHYSFRAGWMVMENTRLSAGWAHNRASTTVNLPGHSLRSSLSSDSINLDVKHLVMMGNDTALSLNAGVTSDTDFDHTAYGAGFDYYPTRRLSFGAGVGHSSLSTNYDLRTRYFITPNVSAEATWFHPEHGDSRVSLGLTARF
jgi:hypothetical protein